MTPSPLANWLNSACAWFDTPLLTFLHHFSEATTGFFTPWWEVLGVLTDNGIAFLGAGVLFFFLGWHRRAIALVGAVGLAGVLTLVAKALVARPRPSVDPDYLSWWTALGVPAETGWAFPSGHTATAVAAAVVLFLCFDKRWSWLAFVVAGLVGLSRCYLLAHYPSDIVAAVVLGGGVAALWVVVSRAAFARIPLLGGLR